jgi:hypothetical protein
MSQEQSQGEQIQKQELPPDPVHEQKQSYSPPEQGLASDPITEAPKVEPEQKESNA